MQREGKAKDGPLTRRGHFDIMGVDWEEEKRGDTRCLLAQLAQLDRFSMSTPTFPILCPYSVSTTLSACNRLMLLCLQLTWPAIKVIQRVASADGYFFSFSSSSSFATTAGLIRATITLRYILAAWRLLQFSGAANR